jgi:hypothetical protein
MKKLGFGAFELFKAQIAGKYTVGTFFISESNCILQILN